MSRTYDARWAYTLMDIPPYPPPLYSEATGSNATYSRLQENNERPAPTQVSYREGQNVFQNYGKNNTFNVNKSATPERNQDYHYHGRRSTHRQYRRNRNGEDVEIVTRTWYKRDEQGQQRIVRQEEATTVRPYTGRGAELGARAEGHVSTWFDGGRRDESEYYLRTPVGGFRMFHDSVGSIGKLWGTDSSFRSRGGGTDTRAGNVRGVRSTGAIELNLLRVVEDSFTCAVREAIR